MPDYLRPDLSYEAQAKLLAPVGKGTLPQSAPAYVPMGRGAGQPQVNMVHPEGAYPSADILKQLSGGTLLAMREMEGANQELLAPYEHRAFTRDAVQNNYLIPGWPKTSGALMATALAAATPVYSGAKALGLMPRTRSPGGFQEMKQAYAGIYDGLKELNR